MARKRKTLTEELEALERTNPQVKAAAKEWERLYHHQQIGRYKDHLAGRCDPATCAYKHTKEERGQT